MLSVLDVLLRGLILAAQAIAVGGVCFLLLVARGPEAPRSLLLIARRRDHARAGPGPVAGQRAVRAPPRGGLAAARGARHAVRAGERRPDRGRARPRRVRRRAAARGRAVAALARGGRAGRGAGGGRPVDQPRRGAARTPARCCWCSTASTSWAAAAWIGGLVHLTAAAFAARRPALAGGPAAALLEPGAGLGRGPGGRGRGPHLELRPGSDRDRRHRVRPHGADQGGDPRRPARAGRAELPRDPPHGRRARGRPAARCAASWRSRSAWASPCSSRRPRSPRCRPRWIVAHDRATLAEVATRFTPRMPSLRSPSISEMPVDDPLAPRNDADRAWSEFNHHVSGIFVLIMGLLALLHTTGRARWARHWPLVFLGLAAFMVVRNDPGSWPLGPRGFLGGLARRDGGCSIGSSCCSSSSSASSSGWCAAAGWRRGGRP